MRSLKIVLGVLGSLGILGVSLVQAQEVVMSGVGAAVKIEGEVKNGDIVCLAGGQYRLCGVAYDEGMFGVVADEAPVAFEAPLEAGMHTVVASGSTAVRVKGGMTKGDLVTSSLEAGVGQRADQHGYVLGQALEDYTGGEVGTILVAVDIHPSSQKADTVGNLWEAIRQGLTAPLVTPLAAMRYMLAAVLVIMGFAFGFVYFGRMAKAGVEALGRNPMAGRLIHSAILFNILMTLVLIAAGLGVAYLILAL